MFRFILEVVRNKRKQASSNGPRRSAEGSEDMEANHGEEQTILYSKEEEEGGRENYAMHNGTKGVEIEMKVFRTGDGKPTCDRREQFRDSQVTDQFSVEQEGYEPLLERKVSIEQHCYSKQQGNGEQYQCDTRSLHCSNSNSRNSYCRSYSSGNQTCDLLDPDRIDRIELQRDQSFSENDSLILAVEETNIAKLKRDIEILRMEDEVKILRRLRREEEAEKARQARREQRPPRPENCLEVGSLEQKQRSWRIGSNGSRHLWRSGEQGAGLAWRREDRWRKHIRGRERESSRDSQVWNP